MTNLSERVYKQNIINEDIHRLLLEVTDRNTFVPIYERTFQEKGGNDEIRYYESRNGGYLKGCFLDSFEIIHTGSEIGTFGVKKEVFLVENGMLLIFNHIEKYIEEPENDTWFTISEREISVDQTLTEMEKLYLEKEVITRLWFNLAGEEKLQSAIGNC